MAFANVLARMHWRADSIGCCGMFASGHALSLFCCMHVASVGEVPPDSLSLPHLGRALGGKGDEGALIHEFFLTCMGIHSDLHV